VRANVHPSARSVVTVGTVLEQESGRSSNMCTFAGFA
jgi:hypothetical protein